MEDHPGYVGGNSSGQTSKAGKANAVVPVPTPPLSDVNDGSGRARSGQVELVDIENKSREMESERDGQAGRGKVEVISPDNTTTSVDKKSKREDVRTDALVKADRQASLGQIKPRIDEDSWAAQLQPDSAIGCYEFVKLALFSLWLVPLRCVFILVMLVLFSPFLCCLGGCGSTRRKRRKQRGASGLPDYHSEVLGKNGEGKGKDIEQGGTTEVERSSDTAEHMQKEGRKDMDGDEMEEYTAVNGFGKMCFFCLRVLCRVLLCVGGFYHIKVRGKQNLREGRKHGAIVIANHLSYLDPLLLLYAVGPTFVSKSGVAKYPLVGPIAKSIQVIFVTREKKDSRRAVIEEIQRRAGHPADYLPLCLFPEGTTTSGRIIGQFRVGAFKPGVPVVPVIIEYPFSHFNTSWTSTGLLRHLFRLLTQLTSSASVQYLPVYYPNEEERRDPMLYMNNVREYMSVNGKLAKNNITSMDVMALTRAKMGLSPMWSTVTVSGERVDPPVRAQNR
uniref:Phospholipid/glycerol acyltransferase domain-containing protein n=1 Tax=Palpitomonas bilix TaxID=652834 RepID=A0A7S3G5J6_9EUKA